MSFFSAIFVNTFSLFFFFFFALSGKILIGENYLVI